MVEIHQHRPNAFIINQRYALSDPVRGVGRGVKYINISMFNPNCLCWKSLIKYELNAYLHGEKERNEVCRSIEQIAWKKLLNGEMETEQITEELISFCKEIDLIQDTISILRKHLIEEVCEELSRNDDRGFQRAVKKRKELPDIFSEIIKKYLDRYNTIDAARRAAKRKKR